MYTIYIHRFPNGRVYVGCTTQPLASRFGRNGEGYKGSTRIWNAIQEFGWDNIQHDVLATTHSRLEASAMEQYYICQYKSDEDAYGYNTKPGGLGRPLPPVKQISKEKISRANSDRVGMHKDGLNYRIKNSDVAEKQSEGYELGWYSPKPEQGKKISEGKKGSVGVHKDGVNRYVRPEMLQQLLEQGWELGGEPLSDSMKQHLHNINLGKKATEETKQKLSTIRKGTVLVHKGEINRRIKPELLQDYLDNDWELGATDAWRESNRKAGLGHLHTEATKQKMSERQKGRNLGRKHIHKGLEHKMVFSQELADYLEQGWELGRPRRE